MGVGASQTAVEGDDDRLLGRGATVAQPGGDLGKASGVIARGEQKAHLLAKGKWIDGRPSGRGDADLRVIRNVVIHQNRDPKSPGSHPRPLPRMENRNGQ